MTRPLDPSVGRDRFTPSRRTLRDLLAHLGNH